MTAPTILSRTGGLAMTNCFLVADEESRAAVLFDAPDHTVSPLLDEAQARGWDVVGLWLTHGHWDHLADHQVVTGRFPKARVLLHDLDAPMLRLPVSRMFRLPFEILPREPDAFVTDGQVLAFGRLRCTVLHTPGHSPGHVMYHFPEHELLVGGDLIIGGSVGRTDLPGSDPAALVRSLQRVMKLPPQTRLLPGHGQASTLGMEAASNPYVQAALAGRLEP